jgi:hypothetical protein
MTVAEEIEMTTVVERKRPAYDPNNLSPEDEEARKYDDNSEGIDWDEIIASTQDDFEAGRFDFNSEDYPNEEAADAALRDWIGSIVDEAFKRGSYQLHCAIPIGSVSSPWV